MRKCSIVQEEDDEDDVSSCSGHDDSVNSTLNRRGSRSEGKLSHILQEHLSKLPEKSVKKKLPQETKHLSPSHTFTVVRVKTDSLKIPNNLNEKKEEDNLKNNLQKTEENIKNNNDKKKLRSSLTSPKKSSNLSSSSPGESFAGINKCQKSTIVIPNNSSLQNNDKYKNKTTDDDTMKIILESSTAPLPIRSSLKMVETLPTYKTLPLSVVHKDQEIQSLKEILEDVDTNELKITTKSRVVRRPGYEQKRNKFHKTRAASCSSSDASDDDSESRKKRAHKLGATTEKPLPVRRDSHDDSSDSQEPGGNCAGGRGLEGGDGDKKDTKSVNNQDNTTTTTTNSTTSGGKVQRCNDAQSFGKRHRVGRRRNGETRLRESQSLNRITEVQEAEVVNTSNTNKTKIINNNLDKITDKSCNFIDSPTVIVTSVPESRPKSFGARLLQTWNLIKTSGDDLNDGKKRIDEGKKNDIYFDKENTRRNLNKNECKNGKIELLSQYFTVHKKLCVPLPGFFSKGKLYKPRSCDNVTKEQRAKSMMVYGSEDNKLGDDKRWRSEGRHHQQHRGSEGDINQHRGISKFVDESVIKKKYGKISSLINLGDASKCSSLC